VIWFTFAGYERGKRGVGKKLLSYERHDGRGRSRVCDNSVGGREHQLDPALPKPRKIFKAFTVRLVTSPQTLDSDQVFWDWSPV
jgi:hypothetical protein